MTDDQVRALKLLEIDQICLLGVSQGGMIAQYMAADHPEMVKKLILAVTAPNANAGVQDVVTGWIDMAVRGDHTVGNEAASELNRAIAGSELYVYACLGHGAYEEAKDFYDRVQEFCER